MISRHTHFTTVVDTPLGDEVELELPVNLNDWENPDIEVRFTPNHIIIGYLAHDDSPQNPLEDSCGMGVIHHHPQSEYGRRDSDYYAALGCDSYGNPRIDEDKMQMLWRDKVLALPDEVFTPYKPDDEDVDLELFAQDLRLQLADEPAGNYTLWDMVRGAFGPCVRHGNWELDQAQRDSLETALDDHLTWDWDEVQKECWVGSAPDAVMLDLYDHSGVTWSVSGSGMQCQWDTSRGESVWVPDPGARKEIDIRAPIYDHAVVHETSWLKGRGWKYRLEVDNKTIKESDDWIPLYRIAKEIARLRTKAGMPAWNNGRSTAARQLAANAAESYTDYCNGNCYGVVVAVYSMDGDLVEDDACWGYLGSDYAEECLESEMEDMVERYAERDAVLFLVESEGGEI